MHDVMFQAAIKATQKDFMYNTDGEDFSFYPDEEVVKLVMQKHLSTIDVNEEDDLAYFESKWSKVYRRIFNQRFYFNRSSVVGHFIDELCQCANVSRPTPALLRSKRFVVKVREQIVSFLKGKRLAGEED